MVAPFVAAARTLVPELLAEVERLQGGLDSIQRVASVRAIGAHARIESGSERGFLDILAIIEQLEADR
ncbi:hypothetical protein A5720_28050 [Mycolicibacterium conceptionense]|uniref:Uncharacterized protein n=1 Tax=Mycolicibacterium conceptionense TaxID=451644 RepID=A0A1A1X5P6_9MYCO|nr:hypothetical protein A5726_24995 [Mycolicibacterium conceptionense]OBF31688.1 hypothetical protein A5720_28050 [Mycolicibacterium conceptionense]OBH97038.1 hypothetical protein A5716_16875 [Mycolicibacterium conceptionense]